MTKEELNRMVSSFIERLGMYDSKYHISRNQEDLNFAINMFLINKGIIVDTLEPEKKDNL